MSTLNGRHEATTYAGASPATVAKAIIYLAVTVLGLPATTALADGDLSPASLVRFAIAVVGVLVVWRVPSDGLHKAIAAGALAGLQALELIVAGVAGWGDVTLNDWTGVLVAVLAALAVGVTPNAPLDAGTSTGAVGEVHLVTNVADPVGAAPSAPSAATTPAPPWPGPDHPDDES